MHICRVSGQLPQAQPLAVSLPAAVKLFYWMRLAYRDEDALTHPFVNANVALPLFDLDHFGARPPLPSLISSSFAACKPKKKKRF